MLRVVAFSPPSDEWFHLQIPATAEILDVQVLNTAPTVWVLLDPEEDEITRSFRLVATGVPIAESPAELKYCGTFLMRSGTLAYHVFELLPF